MKAPFHYEVLTDKQRAESIETRLKNRQKVLTSEYEWIKEYRASSDRFSACGYTDRGDEQ